MLQPSTIHFLTALKKNNNKLWLDANRKQYDAAKADYLQLVQRVIESSAAFDESLGNLQAKDCVFRVNRDIRFSKDKSPYKTNMGASFSKAGKKGNDAGYYFHAEPGQSFAGGGFYMPSPPELVKIRQEIDYNFEEWNKIVQNKTFNKVFPKGVNGVDVLIRPPKGYDENNPAIGYLKMKGFIVTRPLSDNDLTNKNLLKEIIVSFKAMKPMIDFLNHAVG